MHEQVKLSRALSSIDRRGPVSCTTEPAEPGIVKIQLSDGTIAAIKGNLLVRAIPSDFLEIGMQVQSIKERIW
jgi:hypothetical protein